MIVNVQGPVFQRFTGNEDPDTFDIIRIEILLRAFFDNSIELCREHKDELLDAAIDKLKSSVKFRNFGVPINFLKGGRKIFCVYGKNSSLIRNRYV